MRTGKLLAVLKNHAPLFIALAIALGFSGAHCTIESESFQYGPLSKKGFIHLLDLKSLDLKFNDREMETLPEPRVVVAAIDEKAIQKYGRWPWSRAVIGEFIKKTTKGGAKVIAFDALFADEDKNSSYQNIRRFLTSYDDAELRPESKKVAAVMGALADAKKLQAQSAKTFAELEKRIKQQKAPAKQSLTKALGPTRTALKKTGRALDSAQTGVRELGRRSSSFYQTMVTEVANVSPDVAFADAISESPQTVLGMITYQDEEEFEGISSEAMAEHFTRIEASAIRKVYDRFERDVGGGNTAEMIAPIDGLVMDDMWIHPIKGLMPPLPVLAKEAKGFGFFNISPEGDGVVRTVRLFNKHKDTLYPALALTSIAKFFDGEIRPLDGEINPGETLRGIAIGSDLEIPTNQRGHLLVNYYKNPTDYFPTYSVADFIDESLPAEAYKDKIVLFGMTAHGLKQDLRATAFGAIFGVYIHATAIQNMLDGVYMERYFGFALIEILFYLLLAVALGLILPRLPAWGGLLATVGFAVALFLFDTMFVFPRGYWMLNVLPVIQVGVTFVGINVYGYFTEGREKRKIRNAFQFYLTKSVVDEMLKEPDRLQLGGERRNCTVLFSDIRGFTTISERLSPEELVALLNSYLTPMTNLVFKYDGTLDKYMGDAIMAIFGAPVAYEDHPARACFASLEMMEELYRLQKMWRDEGLPEIDIGIGLNTGPMSVGNMGSEIRFDYTVMGDNVNLGSRLEGINKQYGTNIIISESTLTASGDAIYARELDSVRVKGKKDPVKIFELLGKGKAPDDTQKMIDTFENGITLYKSQEWGQAIAAFQTVQTDLKQNDFASNMYIQRCEAMQATPPGEDWDGVFTMTTK